MPKDVALIVEGKKEIIEKMLFILKVKLLEGKHETNLEQEKPSTDIKKIPTPKLPPVINKSSVYFDNKDGKKVTKAKAIISRQSKILSLEKD